MGKIEKHHILSSRLEAWFKENRELIREVKKSTGEYKPLCLSRASASDLDFLFCMLPISSVQEVFKDSAKID